MRGAGHQTFGLAEQRVVGSIGIWSQRGGSRVITLGVGLPLGSGCRILHIIDAVPLDDPRAFNPGNSRILIEFAVTLPGMHRVETEQMHRLSVETGQVVRIEFHSVYAADAPSRPEEIRGVVVIYIDLGVETAVPALLNGTGVLEKTEILIRAERIVSHIDVVAVAGKIELAVILDQIRCNRDVCHRMELPVKQVLGNPHSAAGTAHIVFASVLNHSNVTGSVASRSYRHWKRVTVGLGNCPKTHQKGGGRRKQCLFHID